MKLHLAVCVVVLLLSAAAHVESSSRRRKSTSSSSDDDDTDDFKLFVFGDTFADVGNVPMSDNKSDDTRAWYYPYGMSDKDHGKKPTGRFSNGLVQSDFVAKLLGWDESPPAERLMRGKNGVDPFVGMNFAVGGAGMCKESDDAPTFDEQIQSFRKLLRHRIIDRNLTGSVALVAFSGSHDYTLSTFDDQYDQAVRFTRNVTEKMADGVNQLLDIGVEKVIVNTLPPLGCRPWFSSENNYTSCYGPMNMVSLVHNTHLRQKLHPSDEILLLDMESSFNKIITNKFSYTNFKHKYTPCCDSVDQNGYCGQEGDDGERKYNLCSAPDQSFFWDYYHPTQAGWKAVMDQHEDSIKDFLDI